MAQCHMQAPDQPFHALLCLQVKDTVPVLSLPPLPLEEELRTLTPRSKALFILFILFINKQAHIDCAQCSQCYRKRSSSPYGVLPW
ncbi:hypothetical protein AAFF_G00100120 [Aldrovandia affinis]|uniref:Uncharacterized protein n=1 Tax=Aldrovandia affinis TaxID=143900 RepID=A0AAD7RV85_9TELE|nr:hypothetical protein AAFF_G00100120 [Aldrovandia affinis]